MTEVSKAVPKIVPQTAPEVAPVPVIIAPEQEPIPVVVASMPPIVVPTIKPATVTKGEGTTLLPTTTEESDRITAGQRHISRVWEYSQALIALAVTGSTVYVLAKLAVATTDVTANQLISAMQLNVMTTLILTFYFARTNHVAIGGVGPKPTDKYEGR